MDIYQGETVIIKIKPKLDGTYYTLTANDVIKFGVKSNVEDENFIINKTLTSSNYNSTYDSYILELSAAETEEIIAADYVYDIGLKIGNTSSANYFYLIKPTLFRVIGTVTKK